MHSALKLEAIDQLLLKNLSLQTQSGEVTCVLGNNGAGKTTLLRLCAGLENPQQGLVFLRDKNLAQLSTEEKSKLIAWLPQHLNRAADFNVLQFMSLAQEQRRLHQGLPTLDDQYKQYLLKSLSAFNVTNHSLRPIRELSGGEWKRVQLAHTWARGVPHLILDEPSEGLDLAHTKVLAQLCREFRMQGSILLSTHDFAFAFAVADKLLIIEKGEVVWRGARDEISSARPLLEKIFGVTFSWVKTHGPSAVDLPVPEY